MHLLYSVREALFGHVDAGISKPRQLLTTKYIEAMFSVVAQCFPRVVVCFCLECRVSVINRQVSILHVSHQSWYWYLNSPETYLELRRRNERHVTQSTIR